MRLTENGTGTTQIGGNGATIKTYTSTAALYAGAPLISTALSSSNSTLGFSTYGIIKRGNVSSAALLGMNATPVLLLQHPAGNVFFNIRQVILESTTGTNYLLGGALYVTYTSTAGAKTYPAAADFSATLLTTLQQFQAQAGTVLTTVTANTSGNYVTADIYLTNATAAFTTGTGTLNYWIIYDALTLQM